MARGRPLTRRLRAAAPAAVGAALTAALLGPALGPGYLLRYDLVQVPSPALGSDALGLGDRLPRAVPWDAFVVGLSAVAGDRFAVQLVAAAALVLAATGAARLTPGGAGARATAAAVAVWNPFVVEQLAIGHVPHLLAYGVLPWLAVAVARAAHRAGPGDPGGRTGVRVAAFAAVAALAALGSVTPGGGVLCVLVAVAAAVATAVRADVRRAAAAVAVVVLAQSPWLVAGALHPARGRVDPRTADLFAVRAETVAGPLVDALGLGGMWNAQALPAGRGTALALASTVLLLALAAAGLPTVAGRSARVPRRPVVVAAACAAACWLVAVLAVLPGGASLLARLVTTVPGAGLLRDGHRWLAVPALAIAVLAGLGAQRLAERVAAPARGPVRGARRAAAHLAVLLALVAVLPDAAGGLSGRLRPVEVPAGFRAAADALDGAPGPGAASPRVLVLPWQPFRRFAWAGDAPVLDPLPRMLDRPALLSDRLLVGDRLLPAEGAGSAAADAALADGRLDRAEADRLGVGWVAVERGTPGVLPALPAGDVLVDTPDLLLTALPDPVPAAAAGPARTRAVLAAHGLWGVLLLGGGLVAAALLAVRPAGRRRPAATDRDRGDADVPEGTP